MNKDANTEDRHIPFAELKNDDGWSSGGEDSDGGDPVPPIPDFAELTYQGNGRQNSGW
jgi:hypothetical protein